ncbi:hypothetical protein [Pyruvatibacter mobilis]|uniref:hypothetical protein n=1 Tax=Pyruvatibacter mobilis TaxID=1712261 RepID=UPI003BAC6C08
MLSAAVRSGSCTDYAARNPHRPPLLACGKPLQAEAETLLRFYDHETAGEVVKVVDVTGRCGPCTWKLMRDEWPGDAAVCECVQRDCSDNWEVISRDAASPLVRDGFNPRVLTGGREF